jgi:hypothetical protein
MLRSMVSQAAEETRFDDDRPAAGSLAGAWSVYADLVTVR